MDNLTIDEPQSIEQPIQQNKPDLDMNDSEPDNLELDKKLTPDLSSISGESFELEIGNYKLVAHSRLYDCKQLCELVLDSYDYVLDKSQLNKKENNYYG